MENRVQRPIYIIMIVFLAAFVFADDNSFRQKKRCLDSTTIKQQYLSTQTRLILNRSAPQEYLQLKYGAEAYFKDTNEDSLIINKLNSVGKIQAGGKGEILSDTSAMYCSYCVILDARTNNMALLHTNNTGMTFVSEMFLRASIEKLLSLSYRDSSDIEYIRNNLSLSILTPDIDERSPRVQKLLIEAAKNIGLEIANVSSDSQWSGTIKVFIDEQLVGSLQNNGNLYEEIVDLKKHMYHEKEYDISYQEALESLFSA